MKASLLVITLLTLSTTAMARELYVDDGMTVAKSAEVSADNEKDMKIATLRKLLDQQQRLYEEKVSYLEAELKKSKERLVEKSINHEKTQAFADKRFAEESSFLKKELVSKTRTLMEYQRQLEKVKPSEDMKNLIKVNTELAVELRKSTDQIAFMEVQRHEAENEKMATKTAPATRGRMPASVEK